MSDNTPAKPPTAAMKCRREKCPSIKVEVLPYGPGTTMYRCVKCKNAWTVATGGVSPL